MSLTCAELITETKALIGRAGDTDYITDERVLRWINDAQREIAEKCIGLECLERKNTTSVDTTQKLSYALADWTFDVTVDATTTNRVCHVKAMYYLDGNESHQLVFKPKDEFDAEIIDPTNSDFDPWYKPERFTRRGDYVELYPLCASAYCNKNLRLDAYIYPPDFTGSASTRSSIIDNADKGLIAYAILEAWKHIGGQTGDANAIKWSLVWDKWLEDFQAQNDNLHAWEANIYGDYVY